MLTPKEKAQELVNAHYTVLSQHSMDSQTILYLSAINCAIVTVSKIVDAIDWHEFEVPNELLQYYCEVGIELYNLKRLIQPNMNAAPFRIHRSELPKNFKFDYDSNGYIHGYFVILENSPYGSFFSNGKELFKCTRPFVLSCTDKLIQYQLSILTDGGLKSQPTILTNLFNF